MTPLGIQPATFRFLAQLILVLFALILCIQKSTYLRPSSSVNGSESMCWKMENTIQYVTDHPVLTHPVNKLPESLMFIGPCIIVIVEE